MKILIASSIYSEAIEKLRAQHNVVCAFNAKEEELKMHIRDREVLIFRSGVQITADVMACAPELKLILRAGSGVDNIDLQYVNQKGLNLVRIPGPGAKAVAEMSFALMLALARNVLEADHLTRQGIWAKHQLTGYLLTGKVLGIIGAGNIGSRVGRLGAAWGMEVLGCVEFPTPKVAERLEGLGIQLADIDEVLSRSDFVSIHVPLKESTRKLIDAKALGRMKQGAFLINLARGGVVDEIALYDTLMEKRLRGAALDVHESEGNGKISPLAGLPNVILTPHIGAGTFDSQREIGEIVLKTIDSFVNGRSAEEFQPQGVSAAVL
ncbi:MAG TPA: hydroxyacid dehydrogenase [Anaerolineales bacterium]|nr:hydroxyacid dehydrogenase [Anaerolineales bacterium]